MLERSRAHDQAAKTRTDTETTARKTTKKKTAA
jgi:hypothetical protein